MQVRGTAGEEQGLTGWRNRATPGLVDAAFLAARRPCRGSCEAPARPQLPPPTATYYCA